jgi:hypothetical protein
LARRLSPEKQLELERLSRILKAFAAWADPIIRLPPEGETLAKAVDRAIEERNLPGLRMVLNDLLPMTQAATTPQRLKLDAALREHAGVSLLSLLERQSARIDRLRKRAKLTSEEQYFLVREHIDLLEGQAEHAGVIAELHALLEQYETNALKRSNQNRDQAL